MVALRQKQQGVAIVMVMLFVAVAVISLSTLAYKQHGSIKRTANLNTLAELRALQTSIADYLAADVIQQSKPFDSPEADWTECKTALPFVDEDVEFVACVYEQNGLFNLNNLVNRDGQQVEAEVVKFKYFLQALELPIEIADVIGDWLDTDEISNGFDQESQYYKLLDPGYLPSQRPLVSLSELGLLKTFREDPKLLEQLLPHVTVLPPQEEPTKINANFASTAMLESLRPYDSADFEIDPEVTIGLFEEQPSVPFATMIAESQTANESTDEAAEPSFAGTEPEEETVLASYNPPVEGKAAYETIDDFIATINSSLVGIKPNENTAAPVYEFENKDSITLQSNYFLIQLNIAKSGLSREYHALYRRDDGQMTPIWQSENTW